MKYIVIEGNIGVGKTTLAATLAANLNAKLLLEKFNSNSFLPKFYNSPDRYSFQLELSFLVDRYLQFKDEILKFQNTESLVIADYHITKSVIFAKKTLLPEELQIFQNIYHIFFENFPLPDLYVYLHADAKILKKNILKRGREYEKNISQKYLTDIENGYDSFISNNVKYPILYIDINNTDFVKNTANYTKLKKAIFNSDYKLGINRLVLG